mmetsp:Transcript_22281/g.56749  ORF Transcript_22281/g.56749 Transcript_22281/m.56749 type:complete len:517 (-) Transcript_22281:249-1799(-)
MEVVDALDVEVRALDHAAKRRGAEVVVGRHARIAEVLVVPLVGRARLRHARQHDGLLILARPLGHAGEVARQRDARRDKVLAGEDVLLHRVRVEQAQQRAHGGQLLLEVALIAKEVSVDLRGRLRVGGDGLYGAARARVVLQRHELDHVVHDVRDAGLEQEIQGRAQDTAALIRRHEGQGGQGKLTGHLSPALALDRQAEALVHCHGPACVQRLLAVSPHAHGQHVAIDKIRAHGRVLHHGRDAQARQELLVADARDLQQLRREDGAGSHDDALARHDADVAAAAGLHAHAGRLLPLHENPRHLELREDLQVGQVRALVQEHGGAAPRPVGLGRVDGRVSHPRAILHPHRRLRVLGAEVGICQGPREVVPELAGCQRLRQVLREVRRARVERVQVEALAKGLLQELRLLLDVQAAVHRGAAAQDVRHGAPHAVLPLDLLGRIGVHHRRPRRGLLSVLLAVVAVVLAALQDDDLCARVGQCSGRGAAGRAGADDDPVGLLRRRHLGCHPAVALAEEA